MTTPSTLGGSPRATRDAHREGVTTEHHDWTLLKAGQLVSDQKVIVIDGETSVEEACETLIKNSISSVPIYDAEKKAHLGMFDYGDMITYLLVVLRKIEVPPEEQTFEVRDLIQKALAAEPVPVKLAADLSHKNPFYSVFEETTLLQAVETFAQGTHRVAVVSQNNELKGILSQSTIVSFLYKNIKSFPKLEALMQKPLSDFGLGNQSILSISADSRVLDALSMLAERKISSLAVVNATGGLVGNISLTDVKYVMKSYRHSMLWNTCFQFIQNVRFKEGIDDGQDKVPVFDIRRDSTLGFAVAKLMAVHAHRVWVTDEHNRACGLVSLTDVLRAFATQGS